MRFSDSGNLRATAPSASSSDFHGLSTREYELARLLGRGLGLAEIADTLELSGHAIARERDQLMQKLGVRNEAHLEHAISALFHGGAADWAEPTYLDDASDDLLSDGARADDLSDLIFAD